MKAMPGFIIYYAHLYYMYAHPFIIEASALYVQRNGELLNLTVDFNPHSRTNITQLF